MRCLLASVLTLLSLSYASASDALVDRLKAYEGRWVGSITVTSMATGYKETYPVEQQYWWDAKRGILKGLAIYVRNERMVNSQSFTSIRDGKLYTEIKQDSGTETYYGIVREDWISWMSTEFVNVTERQLKEQFQTRDGKRYLITEGHDSFMVGEAQRFIVYKGELQYAGPLEAP